MTNTVVRQILHADLDTFFVSVERLQNSSLKGKPVMIGGSGNRGVVASCSYEARAYGVHSGMAMKLARRLCPDGLVVRGDSERYSYYSNMITDIIKDAVPVYEKSSIDEFYIDLTGMDRFFGSYQMACELRQRIMAESGLPISMGFSQNKTVSKIATGEAKPNGQLKVDTGLEKTFLAPLHIKRIPGIGEKTTQHLQRMGIHQILTLQQMPLALMEQVFGKSGIIMWKKANGIDDSPVQQYSERQSISYERTFDQDTFDIAFLRSVLLAMAEKLAFSLRKKNKLSSCITVKIRYSNFDTHTKQLRIPYTASDHVLIGHAKTLFEQLYERRMMIRLIGLRVSHLVSGGYQINLFEDTEEQMNLYQAMDKIRLRFGPNTIQRAQGMGISVRSFNPFNGASSED